MRRQIMLKTLVTLTGTALLLVGLQARTEEKRTEDNSGTTKLSGLYTVVSGEKEGQKEPEERIKGTMVRFTEEAITVTDKDKKETYMASYKLDTGKKPWGITMTSTLGSTKGEVARGLIEKDGDQLRLIYSLPGGDLPNGFKTRAKQLMFVMKPASK